MADKQDECEHTWDAWVPTSIWAGTETKDEERAWTRDCVICHWSEYHRMSSEVPVADARDIRGWLMPPG